MASRDELIAYARRQAESNGIDPEIFVRQINQESGFRPYDADGNPLRSPVGALGIAQFMPGTAAGMGVDPTEPYASLAGAARLMAGYLAKYGDYSRALAAYNAGSGAVDRYGGVPPFEETQRYIAAILGGDASISGEILGNGESRNLAAAVLVLVGGWILLDFLIGG